MGHSLPTGYLRGACPPGLPADPWLVDPWSAGTLTAGQRQRPAVIKIISCVVIAFFYRIANILRRWSNILRFFNGNKGLCYGCRFH